MEIDISEENLAWIDAQVQSGRFATREEVVEEAVQQFRDRRRAERDRKTTAEPDGGCGQHPRVAEAD